ncbi:MSMEG_0570 family nitrogen starvation response protein [Frigidibacter sp. MR17.24]|uniref:MSMEG_0570 family nitrogen starvation response protein n=1 Tax=Frigidibacter sp. MR17.24 TaxID=3127345 RepID=UPI003012D559
MPEVRFTIRWPDGAEEVCYSPSTVIHQHLSAGTSYPLPDFLARARAALTEASDRVAAKYGFACSAAMDQLSRIETQAAMQAPGGVVACLRLS